MSNHISFDTFFISSLLVVLVLFTLLSLWLTPKSETLSYKYRWVFGFFITLTLLFTGIHLNIHNSLLHHPYHFSQNEYHGNNTILKVVEAPSERANSVRLLVDVLALKKDNKWMRTTGKALVYLEKDSSSLNLRYGDKLLAPANFTETRGPSNPYEFDYKRYLAFNNIYHQSYLRSDSWQLLERDRGNKLLGLSFKARDYVLKQIENFGIEGKNYALVSALLLGMRDALDSDMLKEFSAAGAMHVLCVSGLHVGIIFLVLNFSFSFLDNHRRGRYLKAFLVIGFIWFYALITGLAPSVMRAATMFSIITIGKALNRNTSIYNSLSLSAVILIIINPYIIAKLGFWLSYLAVVGIVYLHPKFYNLFKFKNWFADKVWSLACVSLAAQIATSPIAVYYFNQFPNYFLLSNIFVVPLATLIVYSGVALVIFSFIPYISNIIAFILSMLLSSMRHIVSFIEGLPFSTSVLVINQIQMFMVYAFIISLIFYFNKRRPVFLKVTLFIAILFFSITSVSIIKSKTQEKIIVYNLNRGVGIDFIKGQNSVFVADAHVVENQSLIDYHISNLRLRNRINNVNPIFIEGLSETDSLFRNMVYIKGAHLLFGNTKVAFVNRQTPTHIYEKKSQNQYVIYSGLPFCRSHDYLKSYAASTHILHPSLNRFEKRRIEEMKATDSIYDISHRGAFVYKIN